MIVVHLRYSNMRVYHTQILYLIGDKECIVYSGSLSLEFNGPPRMKTYMAFIPYERNEMKSDSRYKDFIKHLK